MIVYAYDLTHRADRHEVFLAAIGRLQQALDTLDRLAGTRLLHNLSRPCSYRFEESWLSAEAHDQQSGRIDKGLFTALLETLSEKPARETLQLMTSQGAP
jgi:hypothetical protein